MKIIMKFSCKECGLIDVECEVNERIKEANVIWWMNTHVLPAVAKKHEELSPNCHPKVLSDLKIPIPKDDPDIWVGKYVKP